MDSGEDPDQTWFGLGVSTISGVYSPGIYSSGKVITQYGSISEVSKDPSKPLYPDITFEGTTYKYAKAGTAEASMQGYYTLSPVRVTVASGANAGNNNYNSTKGSLVKTYHYDHVMVLNEKDYYTVNFEVQYAGESEWVALKDYAQRVENGYNESKLKKPARDSAETPETQTVDGVTYQSMAGTRTSLYAEGELRRHHHAEHHLLRSLRPAVGKSFRFEERDGKRCERRPIVHVRAFV